MAWIEKKPIDEIKKRNLGSREYQKMLLSSYCNWASVRSLLPAKNIRRCHPAKPNYRLRSSHGDEHNFNTARFRDGANRIYGGDPPGPAEAMRRSGDEIRGVVTSEVAEVEGTHREGFHHEAFAPDAVGEDASAATGDSGELHEKIQPWWVWIGGMTNMAIEILPSVVKLFSLLAKIVTGAQMRVIGLIMRGEHIFPMIGIANPPAGSYSLRENIYGPMISGWLLSNVLYSFLKSSRALKLAAIGNRSVHLQNVSSTKSFATVFLIQQFSPYKKFMLGTKVFMDRIIDLGLARGQFESTIYIVCLDTLVHGT
ncbi:hypothetical protein Bca52824_046820 [Brassica carinata]|uniref:Uncharacterized protein n=1 Tax=Brassica carinata TaxID=52824 RepID=A0A8X7RF73_BRACI|nr:hypothetical protein Bca52824_046820 [Brassica carinata]